MQLTFYSKINFKIPKFSLKLYSLIICDLSHFQRLKSSKIISFSERANRNVTVLNSLEYLAEIFTLNL